MADDVIQSELKRVLTLRRTSARNRSKEYLLTAAIDFGTTYSGYAYSYAYNPKKIFANNSWSSTHGPSSHKTPTVILFDETKKFISFGFEAEDKYSELVVLNKEHKWYYFQRFKMTLYSEKVGP